jgi:hypothetical protein
MNLDREMIRRFIRVIKEDYVYTGYIDGFSVQGFFGDIESNTYEFQGHAHNVTNVYLYPHTIFTMQFNGANVISCTISADADSRILLQESTSSAKVDFSYTVGWDSLFKASGISFSGVI